MQFPVLTVKDRSVAVEPTIDHLTKCTKLALRNGYYRGLEIVDSAGMHYRVKDATKVDTLPRSWKFSPFNPMIRVRLEMDGEGRPVSLERAKQLVLRALTRIRSFGMPGEISTSYASMSVEANRCRRHDGSQEGSESPRRKQPPIASRKKTGGVSRLRPLPVHRSTEVARITTASRSPPSPRPASSLPPPSSPSQPRLRASSA